MFADPGNSPVPMNDLSRAIDRDRDRLTAAFEGVLSSGHVVMGPQHRRFEDALREYLAIDHVLGVASGTDALELAIKAVMPPGRSGVLTAANAGGYTSVAARRAGFVPRYADVDPGTLCLNAETVADAWDDSIGVVVVTHLYGLLTDISDIVEYCHARGARVVEDCAQAIGARLGNRAAGTFGDVGTISFYPTKNLGAIGDGGAVITGDENVAESVARIRQYGWSKKYMIEVPGGVNSRLDELQAAFLLSRLPLLDTLNERRREIVAKYCAAAEGGPLRVLPADGASHVAHLAVALSTSRSAIREELAGAGVQTDVHFPIPDYDQPGLGAGNWNLPVTERVCNEVLSLPCFPELTEIEVERVCLALSALR